MSWQQATLNMGLRFIFKPFVGIRPFNAATVIQGRKILAKNTERIRVPGNIHFEKFHLNGVLTEYFAPKSYLERLGQMSQLDPAAEDNMSGRKVLLYFHGGGYITCSPATHRMLTSRLAKYARCEVFAINYRKAPENPYPAALDDAIDAYRCLLERGYHPDKIIFAGDSAGGNLTLAALLKVRELGMPMPASGICLSPWTDLTLSGESFMRNWHREALLPPGQIKIAANMFAGDTDKEHPIVSPVFADLTGLPPLMVHVGTTEVLHSDSVRLAENAKRDGVPMELVEWHDAPHVLPLFMGLVPEATRCFKQMVNFMHKHFEAPAHAESLRADASAA